MTMNVSIRNNAIKSTVAARQGKFVRLVPAEWKWFKRTDICTHGGRDRNRGLGLKPAQFIRHTGCKFRINVQVEWIKTKWMLMVKAGSFVHNHAVAPEVFKTYASNRGVSDEQNAAHVQSMLQHSRKRSAIYEYCLEKGENVVMKDVDNLVQSFNAAADGEDDNDACARRLAHFATADKNNVVTVDETSMGETGVISI